VRLVFQGCVLITTTKIPQQDPILNLIWPNDLFGLVKAKPALVKIQSLDSELKTEQIDLKRHFLSDFGGLTQAFVASQIGSVQVQKGRWEGSGEVLKSGQRIMSGSFNRLMGPIIYSRYNFRKNKRGYGRP
jgi:hypothetical protein